MTYQNLPISSRIAKIGDDSCDGSRGRPLASIDHDEQLHEVVIDRWAGGLDQEDIATSDGFTNLDIYLAIGKALRLDLSQL